MSDAADDLSARLQRVERLFAQLQQRVGADLTIAEASQYVSDLIDAIIDTKNHVDAVSDLDPELRTELHGQLDELY